MGRYLASGVLTGFQIVNAGYSKEEFKKKRSNVLKDMSRIIDTTFYKLAGESDEHFSYCLEPKVFDDNIHDLLRELSDLTFPNVNYFCYFEDEVGDINDKSFIDRYPFRCKVESNGEYYIQINDNKINEKSCVMPLYWMLKDRELRRNIEIYGWVILIWSDEDKYIGEDETNMLRLINNMKTKYYNSKLSKSLIYYVEG